MRKKTAWEWISSAFSRKYDSKCIYSHKKRNFFSCDYGVYKPFRSFAWIYQTRSSRSHTFDWIGVFKNFAKFTAKHLWWSLFFINLKALPTTLFKRNSSTGVFLWTLWNFSAHLFYRILWTTASVSGGVQSSNQLLFFQTHTSGGTTCW